MGVDLFINYSCPFRKEGDISHLQNLLRLKRHLDAMETGQNPARTVRVQIREGLQVRDQVYTRADLRMASSKLGEVHRACDNCPANLKKAFGIRNTIGCHAHIACPMDDFAERILFETLEENAKPERIATEQSNLLRAVAATAAVTGERWRRLAQAQNPQVGAGFVTRWGTKELVAHFNGRPYPLDVHRLTEFVFMFGRFPLRAVDDMLSFFRSFFAVVATYVSTPDGKLDQRRNEQFWSRSRALNELNLFIQLLKHALRLGQGLSSAPDQ